MVFSHVALLALAAPFALAATSGSFNALSFNVAGLPQFLQGNDESGDKTSNTAEVGKRFAQYGYDIIHVQEDFNYHATLYEYDNHTYRTPTSGGVPFGSGLNTLSNFDWIDFNRIKWDKCSDASEFNCFTPKGFTFMRLKVDDGVYVDCYNLHTDAGTKEGNQVARRSNVQQVADHIDTWSVGNAVLVFGDTNSRYTRTEDNINLFHTQNNLTDAWLTLERNNEIPTVEEVCGNPAENSTCEVVDKMFYRGSPVLNLNAKSFAYDSKQFLSANGTTLSDHNPMLVEFEWSSSERLRQSDFIGGPHGNWFSDSANVTAQASPKGAKLSLQGKNRLDAVGITLSDGTALMHGGTGGEASDLELGEDEYVNMVYACQDKYNDHTRVFYLEARTNKEGRVTAGVATNDCATFNAPEGWGLVGFVGQDGDEVDQLAMLWAPV